MNIIHTLKKHLTSNDLVLLGALLAGIVLSWNTVGAMQRNYRLQQKHDQLKAEVELQEIENQNLKYQIQYLKTDGFLELAARDKFNKASPGETMVYLPGSGEAQRQAVATSKVADAAPRETGWKANLKAWWQFLNGNQ